LRPRLAILAAGLLVAAWLAVDLGRVAAPPAPPPPRPRARPPARAAVTVPAMPSRNVFEFVDPPPPPPPAPTLAPAPPEVAEPSPSPEPRVRLVGLVRRGGALRAALAVDGETVVVGAGEAAGGYRVIAVDEEGVRVRAPDGSVLVLAVMPGS
jgi:hypothetical protein